MTYNLLVVDDDPAICSSIVQLIRRQSSHDFCFFSAENGKKAIELVCAQPIDIILSDIKMPVCSGYEMMERLQQFHYAGSVVIISGFDDFDYVRRAMRAGAIDYLLKPISPSELLLALEKCILAVNNRTCSGASHGQEEMQSSIKEMYSQQYELDRLLEDKTIEGDKNGFLLVLETNHLHTMSDMDRYMLFLNVQNSLRCLFSGKNYTLLQGEHQRVWSVLIRTDWAPTASDHSQCKEQLAKAGFPNGLCDLSGHTYREAFHEAFSSLESCFYDRISLPSESDSPNLLQTLVPDMAEKLAGYDFSGFAHLCDLFFSHAGAERLEVRKLKQTLIDMVYNIMSRNNAYIAILSRHRFTECDILLQIDQATHAIALKKDLLNTLHFYMDEVIAGIGQKDTYAVQKAKEYMQQSYYKEITMMEIAEKMGLHPNYFSALFKSQTGFTFSHYLRKIRIDKACEQIRTTDRSLTEIGTSVGYSDTANFSRAFKKVMGLSPTQYKDGNKMARMEFDS